MYNLVLLLINLWIYSPKTQNFMGFLVTNLIENLLPWPVTMDFIVIVLLLILKVLYNNPKLEYSSQLNRFWGFEDFFSLRGHDECN